MKALVGFRFHWFRPFVQASIFTVLVCTTACNPASLSLISEPTASSSSPDDTGSTEGETTGNLIAGSAAAAAVSDNTITVSWTAATDPTTSAQSLQYKVVKGLLNSSINSIAKANAVTGSDLILDWTAGSSTVNATNLNGSTSYAFAVLVKNDAAEITLYDLTSATTQADLTAICFSIENFGMASLYPNNASTCVEMKPGSANRTAFEDDCAIWNGGAFPIVENTSCTVYNLVGAGGNASDTQYCTADDPTGLSWSRIYSRVDWRMIAEQTGCDILGIPTTWHQ